MEKLKNVSATLFRTIARYLDEIMQLALMNPRCC